MLLNFSTIEGKNRSRRSRNDNFIKNTFPHLFLKDAQFPYFWQKVFQITQKSRVCNALIFGCSKFLRSKSRISRLRQNMIFQRNFTSFFASSKYRSKTVQHLSSACHIVQNFQVQFLDTLDHRAQPETRADSLLNGIFLVPKIDYSKT